MPVSYNDVFGVKEQNFNETAIEIFQFQAHNNAIYKEYLSLIGANTSSIRNYHNVPHLPIEFFKSHVVKTGDWQHKPKAFFESSSTTGKNTSKHYIGDIEWYNRSFLQTFSQFYGDVSEWCILALLPNYLERRQSSLVSMTQELIRLSRYDSSGFYLYNHDELKAQLEINESKQIKTLLIGVSFALLDIAETINSGFKCLTILETGGMKGRRKEMIRSELHETLRNGFGDVPIHSEYGMTELFSQAYSMENQLFETPNWMKVTISQLDDPFGKVGNSKNGLINVIDLANVQTCSFIATSDIGRLHKGGRFEVLGRFDHSEQRGCNLLIT